MHGTSRRLCLLSVIIGVGAELSFFLVFASIKELSGAGLKDLMERILKGESSVQYIHVVDK